MLWCARASLHPAEELGRLGWVLGPLHGHAPRDDPVNVGARVRLVDLQPRGSGPATALTGRALAALDQLPPMLDTTLVFPAPKGGHIGLDAWRTGVQHRSRRRWHRQAA